MADEQKTKLRLEIAHVLFIDIVGYSKLLITEQGEVLRRLTEIVRQTEQFRHAESEGKLVRIPTGDGMALVFRDLPEAPAECALEVSRALKSEGDLPIRMGIHSGPVNEVVDVNDRANVTGAGINLAQRVMDCGDGGHILLSKHVADDLEQYPQWRPLLHDLGECEVKHGTRLQLVNLYSDTAGNPAVPKKFQRAAAPGERGSGKSVWPRAAVWLLLGVVLLVAALFALRWVGPNRRSAPSPTSTEGRPSTASLPIPEKSIAVLPFDNLSRDPDNAYFAEGIQDEVLTRLSKIADLKVISRTSTQHYTSNPADLPEIGRQLRVAHVVEGSVQKSGEAVRVNVQLIRAADDSHLWAETFDRKLDNVFAVETDVAKSIAEQLRAHITGQEQQVIAAKPTENPQAYDSYLRGLAYKGRALSPDNFTAAQKYFKEAVQLDPKFATAWAMLAQVDALGYLTSNLSPTSALRDEAHHAAETATELQPSSGEALLAQGYYHYACLRDYDAAIGYFEQARKFLPNDSQIPEALAYVARRRGNWDASESCFNQSEQLTPRDVNLLTQHAVSYNLLRRFAEANDKLDRVLEIIPGDRDTIRIKAVVAQAQGDLPEAAALLASIPQSNDGFFVRTEAYQAILERRTARIVPRLRQVLAATDQPQTRAGGVLPFLFGMAQEIAGDHIGAQQSWRETRVQLEKSLAERPESVVLMASLAMTYAELGEKALATDLAERAMATTPIEKDRLLGALAIEARARVAAIIGETDRAIELLEKVLTLPCEGPFNLPLTPAILRLDPMFDPLRNDPRFQKLAVGTPEASPK